MLFILRTGLADYIKEYESEEAYFKALFEAFNVTYGDLAKVHRDLMGCIQSVPHKQKVQMFQLLAGDVSDWREQNSETYYTFLKNLMPREDLKGEAALAECVEIFELIGVTDDDLREVGSSKAELNWIG